MKIGDKIKFLREDKGITQKELANALHLSNSAIGMYETNQSAPSLEVVKDIANFFHVSTDYLLDNDDISFAFSDGDEGLTPEDIEDVKRYIEFVKSKRRK